MQITECVITRHDIVLEHHEQFKVRDPRGGMTVLITNIVVTDTVFALVGVPTVFGRTIAWLKPRMITGYQSPLQLSRMPAKVAHELAAILLAANALELQKLQRAGL